MIWDHVEAESRCHSLQRDSHHRPLQCLHALTTMTEFICRINNR